MDRQRRRALALAFLLAAAATGLGSAAEEEQSVRALSWLVEGADPVLALDRPPGECLAPPADPGQAYLVEVGRVAFRTPTLLGGQAARAGVTCESCHQSGRSNPHFAFPGVSGAPGTADVTSSMFSSHRGDGVDNPKPIPDLGGPKAALKVSQQQDGALEAFIRGLIVEEFDGHEPTPAVLDGVAAYVRALEPQACPVAPGRVTMAKMMEEARRAARAGVEALARGDRATAMVMIAGARARLGLIDERFQLPGLEAADARLRSADADLAQVAEMARVGAPADQALQAWIDGTAEMERALGADEGRSLFEPLRLRAEAARVGRRGLTPVSVPRR